MLEVVAHERDAEVVDRQGPVKLQAVGLDETDPLREGVPGVTEIRGPALSGSNVPDEIAEIAPDVQDRPVDHVPTEMLHDRRPDPLLGRAMALREPGRVDALEVIAHRRPASSSARIHGMTSSSIASSVVVASTPRNSRDWRTS